MTNTPGGTWRPLTEDENEAICALNDQVRDLLIFLVKDGGYENANAACRALGVPRQGLYRILNSERDAGVTTRVLARYVHAFGKKVIIGAEDAL